MSVRYIRPIFFLVTIAITLQFAHCFNEVRFVPGSGDNNSGSIEVLRSDGSLLPICYLGNDYGREAVVICRQMGYVGGFVRYDKEQYIASAFVEILDCTGLEMSISECTIIDHPYTDDCGNITIGAECFNTTGARLIDTDQPNIGRVQVEYNDIWADVCFDGGGSWDSTWDNLNLMVLCRQLGYPGSMLYMTVAISSNGGTSVDDFKCRGDELLLQDCHPDSPSGNMCYRNEGVIASCAAPGYIGCISDIDPVDSLLPDYENADNEHPWWTDDQMTIQKCISSCRNHSVVMSYAGLKEGNRCFCGSSDRYTGLMMNIQEYSRCYTACSGNRFEICGTLNRLSVYDITVGHCGDPGNPVNGRHFSTDFLFGSVVKFACFPGYELVGSDSAQCVIGQNGNEAMWNNSIPACVAQPTTTKDIAKLSVLTTIEPTTVYSNSTDNANSAVSSSNVNILLVLCVTLGIMLLICIAVICIFLVKRKYPGMCASEVNKNKSEADNTPMYMDLLPNSREQQTPSQPHVDKIQHTYMDATINTPCSLNADNEPVAYAESAGIPSGKYQEHHPTSSDPYAYDYCEGQSKGASSPPGETTAPKPACHNADTSDSPMYVNQKVAKQHGKL